MKIRHLATKWKTFAGGNGFQKERRIDTATNYEPGVENSRKQRSKEKGRNSDNERDQPEFWETG